MPDIRYCFAGLDPRKALSDLGAFLFAKQAALGFPMRMKIISSFLSGGAYWQAKIRTSCEQASEALSDPALLQSIRDHEPFDFTDQTPDQIADHFAMAGEIVIHVGFYSSWLTRAIAYEEQGAVFVNTRKEAYGAGSPGNMAHETAHAMDYEHDGNSAAGNENTVPYVIGNLVDAWIKAKANIDLPELLHT